MTADPMNEPKECPLKPCPACSRTDAETKIHEHRNLNSFWTTASIRCRCGFEAHHGSPEAALTLWNTRATDAECAAMREALERISMEDIFDVTIREIATAALSSTAGSELLKERDELRERLTRAEAQFKADQELISRIKNERQEKIAQAYNAESERDTLRDQLAEARRILQEIKKPISPQTQNTEEPKPLI